MVEGGMNVVKDQCYTIQHFAYECRHERNDAGFPYGTTTPSKLVFTIKLESPDNGKEFYQHMKQNELFDYTFLFNASFGSFGRLSSFDDAMTVKGYMIDVEEFYDGGNAVDGHTNQVLIKGTLLLSSIAYKSTDSDKILKITHF